MGHDDEVSVSLGELLENARDIIYSHDLAGNFTYLNKAAKTVLGYEWEDARRYNIADVTPPDQLDFVRQMMARKVQGEASLTAYETEVLTKDGRRIPVEILSQIIYKGEKPVGVQGIARDITRRKQLEQRLSESESRYRTFVDNIPEIIYGLSVEDGTFTFLSPSFEKVTGWPRSEWIGKSFIPIVHPDDRTLAIERFQQVKEGMTPPPYELRILSKSGDYLIGEFTNRAIIKNGIVTEEFGFAINITERRKAEKERARIEAQLFQSQKMEAIGTLSGGIAHDFNNILQVLMLSGNVLKRKLREDDPLKSHADQILISVERAIDLTQSLLTFSRKQITNPKPVILNEIIKKVEKLLLRLIGEDIEMRTMLTGDNTTIMADYGQIEQVLMNLATNARDAMPKGGKLIIKTEILNLNESFIKPRGLEKPGEYVLLSVTDTGIGMDEKTKERIFEPFFTTKETGKGTGLGLAMVYGIIKQHSGHIDVYSELGHGSTFRIYLPALKSEVEKTRHTETATLKGGSETVLLVEDDNGIRVSTKNLLEEFGYKVIEAINGEDAVNKFVDNKDKIQLVISDLIMPRKSGKDAYEEMRKIKPDIKAVFMSGYAGNTLDKKGITRDEIILISKPVSPDKLLEKIREVLG